MLNLFYTIIISNKIRMNNNDECLNLVPLGGLCNKLRMLLSYKTKYPNKKINVYWIKNNEYPEGEFLDFFEPIENVTFYNYFPSNLSNCISNGKQCCDFNVKYLKLNKKLNNIIKNIISKYFKDGYISCHIRRTDHYIMFKNRGKTTEDDKFYEFLENNKGNIYIASDNSNTQIDYYNKFKDRIKYIKFIKKKNNLRQTSMLDSVIDLFLCVESDIFMGTYWSSYSNMIEKLRKNKKY